MLKRPAAFPIAVLVLTASLLGACDKAEAPKQAEVRPVRTLIVDPAPVDDDRQAVGEIKPRYESDLPSASPARCCRARSTSASSVKAGDALATLDVQDYENRLRSAEADVVSAEASLRRRKGPRAARASSSRTATRRNPTTTRRCAD